MNSTRVAMEAALSEAYSFVLHWTQAAAAADGDDDHDDVFFFLSPEMFA